jgi:hypothetical protein
MDIKDIASVISVLEKIKMPKDPTVRHKIFSIISELKSEKVIQDEIKKSYITPEIIRMETEKRILLESLNCEHGKIIIGEYKLVSLTPVEELIRRNDNHPDMVALNLYNNYTSSEYKLKCQGINIDETDDEMFLDLSEEEISHLMSIIK